MSKTLRDLGIEIPPEEDAPFVRKLVAVIEQPQRQHGQKSTPSQHDKRSGLSDSNPARCKTEAASVPLVGGISIVVAAMQSLLHARIGFRLPIVMAGALLARGRRTASSWFRAVGFEQLVYGMIGIAFTRCLSRAPTDS